MPTVHRTRRARPSPAPRCACDGQGPTRITILENGAREPHEPRALSVLHSAEDPTLLREDCADRSLKQLGLQLISPAGAFGIPIKRAASERSARQRARALAAALKDDWQRAR